MAAATREGAPREGVAMEGEGEAGERKEGGGRSAVASVASVALTVRGMMVEVGRVGRGERVGKQVERVGRGAVAAPMAALGR